MREFSSRRNELGKINELGRKSSSDIYEDMMSQADEINRMLDSLDFLDEEDDKKIDRDAIYGVDQEAVRKEEKREIKYNSKQNNNNLFDRDEARRGIDELNQMISELYEIDDNVDSKHM